MSSGTYLECIKPPKLLAAKVAGFCLQFISLFLLLVGHEGWHRKSNKMSNEMKKTCRLSEMKHNGVFFAVVQTKCLSLVSHFTHNWETGIT